MPALLLVNFGGGKNFAICSWDNDICHARTQTHTPTHTHLYFITFLVYKAKLGHFSRCRKLPVQRTPRLRYNRDNTELYFWNRRHIICRHGNKWTATHECSMHNFLKTACVIVVLLSNWVAYNTTVDTGIRYAISFDRSESQTFVVPHVRKEFS